jgi:hypothetical protein
VAQRARKATRIRNARPRATPLDYRSHHDRLERAFGKRSDGETRPVAKPNFLDLGNIGVNLHATEIACDRKESGRFGIWRDHLADHDTA